LQIADVVSTTDASRGIGFSRFPRPRTLLAPPPRPRFHQFYRIPKAAGKVIQHLSSNDNAVAFGNEPSRVNSIKRLETDENKGFFDGGEGG